MLSLPSFSTGNATKTEERYYLGCDLGFSVDSTALVALRRIRWLKTDDVHTRNCTWTDERPSEFQVGLIERLPLGTSYPSVVAYVGQLMERPLWRDNIDLIVDGTGVGVAVVSIFQSAGVPHIAATITAGNEETRHGRNWHIPKIELVSGVQALLHEGRLKIQKDLPEANTLVDELQTFSVKHTDAGRIQFAASGSKHDDVVLALCLAVHMARRPFRKTKILAPTGWMGR